MKVLETGPCKIALASAVLALAGSAATAGGLDRVSMPYAALFESGTYAELSFGRVSSDVTGTFAPALGGGSTGDMAGDYSTLSFAFRNDLSDALSYAFFVNTPYNADADYRSGPYTGLNAKWDSTQAALVLRYRINPAVSVYGGARYVSSKASINVPDALVRGGLAAAGAAGNVQAGQIATLSPAGSLAYAASASQDGKFGVIVGAAFEQPEIALRVGLTYESRIRHDFPTTEAVASPFVTDLFGSSSTEIELPQTLTLDFQSGVAKDTLVFGSVRWAEWSQWDVRPIGYETLTGGNVTDFEDDVFTWQLGVGRKISNMLSVFARATYETTQGTISSPLSPTDGVTSIGFGGTWRKDALKVTGGVEYAWLGNAVDGSGTQFQDNRALGFGLTVGYNF